MIGVFGVIFRNDVNPARFGVVLTYAMAATSSEPLVPEINILRDVKSSDLRSFQSDPYFCVCGAGDGRFNHFVESSCNN